MKDLKNRVALVTGASRGIGAGIAIALAHAGADIAVNYSKRADVANSVCMQPFAFVRRAFARSLPFAGLLLLCSFGVSNSWPSTSPQMKLKHEINRVEQGLWPAAIVQDRPTRNLMLRNEMFTHHVTAVTIAVIQHGAVRWSQGFGTLKVGGAPANADTMFQAASISKPVTAFAALRLVQSGKLNLDEDVNRYLKSWKVPTNSFTQQRKVTLRELLTHTAGIAVAGFPGYVAGTPLPKLREILDGISPANTPPIRVDTIPGTEWRYSGGGYVVVQQVLMDVTGESFPRLMQELVLNPLGMSHSTFEQPIPIRRKANAAIPYRATGEEVQGGAHTYPEMAAAGLWTTAADLARFAVAVQNALSGQKGALLSHELAKQMVASEFGKRGILLGVGGSAESPYFAHSGGNEGFECYLVAYERGGNGAVIMTNGDGDSGFDLTQEVIRSIAHEYGWPDFHPAKRTLFSVLPKYLEEYRGCYKLPSGVLVVVTPKGDHLFVQSSTGDSWEMFAESETEFFSKLSDVQIVLRLDNRGHSTGMLLREYGEGTEARRTEMQQ